MRKNYYLVAAAALFFALTISPAISYAAETTVLICDSILAGFKCELDNFYNLGKAGQEVNKYQETDLNKQIEKLKPNRIFIMLGINDLGKVGDEPPVDKDMLFVYYVRMLAMIREVSGAKIYIFSILPVNNLIHGDGYRLDNGAIRYVNARLKGICDGEKLYFIDLDGYFADESGMLNKNYTEDGLHILPASHPLVYYNIISNIR